MDRLANGGLRYTNFHTTAMCSPTRAALMTGRNHHAAGLGIVTEFATGFPGYAGRLTKRAATLAEMLRPHGYNTFAVGKWHLMPLREATAAGPFDAWPLQRGFDRWYGFPAGYTDQWYPELCDGNQPIDTPRRPGYHLSEDLIDHAIEYVRDQQGVAAEQAVLPVRRVRRRALAAPGARRLHREVPWPLRRGLGRRARASGWRGRRRWASCRPTRELPPLNDRRAGLGRR